MAEIYKVAESWMTCWIRSGPSSRYSRLGVIYGRDNKEYTVTERQNKWWLKIAEGQWVCEKDSNGRVVMNKTGTTQAQTVQVQQEQPMQQVDEESYAWVPDSEIIVYSKYKNAETEYFTDLEDNFTISNLRGIFGMPYQFLQSADPRVSDKEGAIGRKYAKEVVASMPLLLITPGVPRFMGEYNSKQKAAVLSKFVGYASGLEENLQAITLSKKFGKYYTLEYSYEKYYEYVNPMCRVAARYMNLHEETVDGVKLDELNWAYQTNKAYTKLFSIYKGCTAWYCDSEKDISDSFSNNTTQSMLAEKVNGLSDYGREFQFLLGTANSIANTNAFEALTGDGLSNLSTNINDFVNKAVGNSSVGGIFKTLTNSIATVIAGGKLVFPEIWSDSSFSRSYDIKLKLVSPDGDDLSIYLNIIVPILHLMGLALPREIQSAGANGHGYNTPFLVRAFYKGLFNVDMGIITDLNITKGKESAWTPSGVPLTVDVSLTIKDLYNDIYITNNEGVNYNIMNNIILMDYIGNLCGININEPDIYRGIDLFFTQNIKNRITDTWHLKIWKGLDNWVTNKWQSIFGKF